MNISPRKPIPNTIWDEISDDLTTVLGAVVYAFFLLVTTGGLIALGIGAAILGHWFGITFPMAG